MKLGDVIKKYRIEHGESQRSMSKLLKCSYQYVGLIEKGINPKTKKPVTPSLEIFKSVSNLLGISIDELLRRLDADQLIKISSKYRIEISTQEKEHIEKYRALDEAGRGRVDNTLNYEYEQLKQREAPKIAIKPFTKHTFDEISSLAAHSHGEKEISSANYEKILETIEEADEMDKLGK